MVRFLNFVLYQAGWFACVLGAAWHFPWLGASVALCLLGTHLWLATDRSIQLKLALVAAGCGLVVDTVQLWAGVFAFSQGVMVDWLPPPWMTILWIQFATTFRYSMSWLSGNYALSAGFAVAGAPLAFFAGERLGAIEFLPPRLMHYAVLAMLWALALPMLIFVADRLASRSTLIASYRWVAGASHERRAADGNSPGL